MQVDNINTKSRTDWLSPFLGEVKVQQLILALYGKPSLKKSFYKDV